jgi:hypothetical protein
MKTSITQRGRIALSRLVRIFISSRNRELIAVVLASVTLALVICQPMIVVIIRHWMITEDVAKIISDSYISSKTK